jgi:hypothetical protein
MKVIAEFKKHKKIIVREGLIFLGFLILAILGMPIATIFELMGSDLGEVVACLFMFWLYPLYWLIRFILWGIRKLK